MSKYPKLKFQGRIFILVGSKTGDENMNGAIATKEEYLSGRINFAHLNESGTITRYHEKIGTIKDIEWLGDIRL